MDDVLKVTVRECGGGDVAAWTSRGGTRRLYKYLQYSTSE